MPGDKDILGKADGLMKRHGAGVDPAAVPVLTDLVDAAAIAPAREPPSDLAREIFPLVIAVV
jgi:hypothetical protein